MVTIGNTILPGTTQTIESAASAGANIGAPGTPVLVGQAYLDEGTATANEVYRVTRTSRARELFGPEAKSMLTRAVVGALVEGAYPAYAVPVTETEVTAEDLSGVASTTATLANAPVQEVAADITFTVNSTEKDTVLYYDGDPSNASPGTDEVYLNPQTGKAEADESFGNTGDEVDYTYVDYSGAFDAIEAATIGDTYVRNVVDFIVAVDENSSVKDSTKTASEDMEAEGWFNIALAGAGEPYIIDAETATDETDGFSSGYDTSRLQLIYPSRDSDGNTIIGEYAGRRSALGIDAFPIFKNIDSVTSLQRNLKQTEKENLAEARVNPLEEAAGGVRIVEDYTTVTGSNADETAWQRGFARLLTDFVVEQADARAAPFIGDFNERSTLNAFRGNLSSELKPLLETGQIQAFSLVVEKEDSLNAIADIGIKTADPLRNIEITVAAGEVVNGVSATGGDN
jgi:hypothetical protein